uniref:CASP-like protein n=1 Tax=Anthurium amnicola TaxID=1678845 RepID=A0A1D1YKD5_9ARAE
MASTTPDPVKKTLETEAAAPPPTSAPGNALSMVDLTLRLLLFATTLTSLVVMVASKQTKVVTIPLPLPFPRMVQVLQEAKFTQSPAIIYFVVAHSVACLHSLLSSVVLFYGVSKPSLSSRLLLGLALVDTVMAGVVASAMGAVSSLAYVALKGNKHVGWVKVCNVFDKFCHHLAGSIIISLISSIILCLLVMLSTYSLYRRTHNKS